MSKTTSALPAQSPKASFSLPRGLILIAAATVLLAAPFLFYPVMLMKVLCFALFASAVNLLLGYAGLLSFGHAMYFGGAAYVCAYARKELGWAPEASILAGVAFSAVFGLLTGLLSIRRSGIYFAMVTLALGQLFYFLCLQSPATGGEDGIQSVPRGALFGVFDLTNNLTLYYVVLAFTGFGMLVAYRAVHSPFGQILTAIRENEPRAVSLGYRVAWFKALAFTLSAALAGLAGATKVFVFQLASLTDVSAPMSGEVVLMTLVGGMGTTLGPAVGAAIIVSMQNYLADVGEWLIVIQGLIFIAAVSLFRRGIVGEIAAWLRKRRSR